MSKVTPGVTPGAMSCVCGWGDVCAGHVVGIGVNESLPMNGGSGLIEFRFFLE